MKKIFHLQIPLSFLNTSNAEALKRKVTKDIEDLMAIKSSRQIMLSTFDEKYPGNGFILTEFIVPEGSIVLLDSEPIGDRLQIIPPTPPSPARTTTKFTTTEQRGS